MQKSTICGIMVKHVVYHGLVPGLIPSLDRSIKTVWCEIAALGYRSQSEISCESCIF